MSGWPPCTDAVTAGDSEAVGSTGFQAHVTGQHEHAATAWQALNAIDEPGAQWLRRAADFSRTRHQRRAELPARQRLLDLTQARYGPDHPEVAMILGNLGATYRKLGEPGKARDLLERALTIKEREYGPDHPQVAITLTNLGIAYSEPGKARDLLERALTIKEREYGPDHPQVAMTLTNLGATYRKLGEPGKVRDLLERALTIKEREYGPDHPQVAMTLTNLGIAYHDLGQPDDALRVLARALRLMHAHFPAGHPHIDFTRNSLRRVDPEVVLLDDGRVARRATQPTDAAP